MAAISSRRFTCVFCVTLLFTVAALGFAAPPTASPPIGTWSGETDTGSVVTLTVTADRGVRLDGAGFNPVVGVWTWTPTADSTGTLTVAPADMSSPATIYRVRWLTPMRIEMSSAAFEVILNRII